MEKRLFGELLDIMKRLRGEGGCPWDRAQTIESIKPFLVEECYEAIEAIENGDPQKIQEELGDLLYQIIFLAQIGEEEKKFDIGDVLNAISQKMIRRHPHVFSDETAKDIPEVLAKWEKIKQEEQGNGKGKKDSSVLDGIPKGLPAMTYAHRVQAKAARTGFDWTRIEEVLEKLDEEILEFKEALGKGDIDRCGSEFGDIIFTLINISRFLGLDPEGQLRKATARFDKRFRLMEKMALQRGQSIDELDLAGMDSLWESAKVEIS